MRHDAEPTEPLDIFDDVTPFTGQPVRRSRHAQRDVVPGAGADLDAVEDEHSVDVPRRVHELRGVAVVREHDEVEAGAGRGLRHVLWRAGAVGSARVHVERPANGPGVGRKRERPARGRQQPPDGGAGDNGDHQDRKSEMRHRRGWKRSYTVRSRASRTCV